MIVLSGLCVMPLVGETEVLSPLLFTSDSEELCRCDAEGLLGLFPAFRTGCLSHPVIDTENKSAKQIKTFNKGI